MHSTEVQTSDDGGLRLVAHSNKQFIVLQILLDLYSAISTLNQLFTSGIVGPNANGIKGIVQTTICKKLIYTTPYFSITWNHSEIQTSALYMIKNSLFPQKTSRHRDLSEKTADTTINSRDSFLHKLTEGSGNTMGFADIDLTKCHRCHPNVSLLPFPSS